MATVIMVYTLMAMIQYIYDFSDIDMVQIKKMTELDSIQYIKDSLNQTVISSNSSLDCDKVGIDLNSARNFLKTEMISRGLNLTVSYSIVTCPPNVNVAFNFTIRSPNAYTFTQFNSP